MNASSPASDVSVVGATVSHADFAKISAILYDIAGIKLNDGMPVVVDDEAPPADLVP